MNSDKPPSQSTDQQRRASWEQLRKLHPGNRLRLMAGLPLLDQTGWNPETQKMETPPPEDSKI